MRRVQCLEDNAILKRIRHPCQECGKPAKVFYMFRGDLKVSPTEVRRDFVSLVARCTKHVLEAGPHAMISQEDYEVAQVMES